MWDGVGTDLVRREAAYTYNGNGRKTSLTDARGYRAELRYDAFDRQSRWIFPSRTTPGVADQADYEEYRHDPAGNRTSLRKRDGAILTFQHDALSRMTAKTVPASAGGAAGYSVFYGYDNRGLQTSARFGAPRGVGITHAYDGFGRLVAAWTDMDGTLRRLSSDYDPDGRRTILWDNGVSYSGRYGYDGLGRMSYYLEGFGPVAFQIFHDGAGRRSRVELGVGGVSSTMSYGYDAAGRLGTLTRDLAGPAWDQSLGFAYNPASQIVSRTGSNDAYAWTGSYAVSRDYAANGLNQYTGTLSDGTPSATFAYDANGNLTSDGSTSFVYDAENRLVSASGAKNATLAYDPLGRLWQISSPAKGTTRFLYDGDDLIQEYDGAGNLLRDYDHASGPDEPLIWHEYAGGFSRRFLHADHQGSIVAVTDTNGSAIAINSYDEYGIPGPGNLGRFQYTGQTWLRELGMYYYKARIYSPTLGRFLQVDPIGYDDQINLYAYVGNDPINRTDPTGEAIDIIADVGFLIYDTYKIAKEGATRENVAALAADAAATFVPGVTGAGLAVRGAARGAEVARGAERGSPAAQGERTHQTYTKTNPRTDEEYTGRTSGSGTPAQNVARRDQGHHLRKQDYGPARLDRSSRDPQAIRGREQQMIERNGGARSQGGTSGNRINGISDRNPKGPACRAKATKEFGPC